MVELLPIRLAAGSGETFGVDDLACAAATQLGFWKRRGLDVSWTPRHGGVAAMRAVLDGEADVAYAGLGPVLGLRAQGHPCRIVVSMARALAQNLVVQRRITRPQELAGASWALDGFGALSHHMARLTVRALGIDEADIGWEAVGPPPQRIARLLDGTIDASLIRVEEALSLGRTAGDKLHTLLGFAELKSLVQIQPHGVLATTEAFEAAHGETLRRLVCGMVEVSRALHDDFDSFRRTMEEQVTVPLEPEDVRMIWQRERDNGGFAVNGELTRPHWAHQLESYAELNPELRPVSRAEVIAEEFLAAALADIGVHPAAFDQPEA